MGTVETQQHEAANKKDKDVLPIPADGSPHNMIDAGHNDASAPPGGEKAVATAQISTSMQGGLGGEQNKHEPKTLTPAPAASRRRSKQARKPPPEDEKNSQCWGTPIATNANRSTPMTAKRERSPALASGSRLPLTTSAVPPQATPPFQPCVGTKRTSRKPVHQR